MIPLVKNIVSLTELKQGDTVEIDGKTQTVDISRLKFDSFMGATYQGQPFRKGIVRVKYKVPTASGFRYE